MRAQTFKTIMFFNFHSLTKMRLSLKGWRYWLIIDFR